MDKEKIKELLEEVKLSPGVSPLADGSHNFKDMANLNHAFQVGTWKKRTIKLVEVIEELLEENETYVVIIPWESKELKDWDIVGCNHYQEHGKRHLFVSMSKDGRCIKAEGTDERKVFRNLVSEAKRVGGKEKTSDAVKILKNRYGEPSNETRLELALDDAQEELNRLLHHVESSFPNESRYETALRYIKEAENRKGGEGENTKM